MNFDIEKATESVVSEYRSAQIWINIFRKNRDAPSIRCLMFALGRVSGALTVWEKINQHYPENSFRSQIQEISRECEDLFTEASAIPIRNSEM